MMSIINELYKEFIDIKKLNKQKRGFALEKFFVKLMKVSNIPVIKSFKIVGEQIDGAIKYEGHYYLVEIKWLKEVVAASPIYGLRGKLEGKQEARGIFISMAGYSTDALEAIVKGKTLNTILLDGQHLYNVLTKQYSFKQLLDYTIMMASTRGEIYCPHDIPTTFLESTIRSTPQIFKTLESVLDRSSEFFPNRSLFDENLIYFTIKEHQVMQEIQDILLSDTEDRMYLLYGDPASGKTVMGLAIANDMKKQGYTILYHKLTDKTNFDTLWSDFITYGNQKVLFIVDDCHLNMRVGASIYRYFDNIEIAACLLISRNLPKNLRLIEEYELLDIFEKLEGNSFELDTTLDEQLENKMSGIIQRYKEYYEKNYNRGFIIGDEKQIIHNVRRNFLSLYFYLSFWPDIDQLDQLNENLVLEKMYTRYLDNPSNKPFMNLFLKYTALYQYEIQFEPNKKDIEGVRKLTVRGLLEYNSETGYYTFYHSDFAKLLLQSYASRPLFKRKYNDLQKYTINQIKLYVSSFKDYPSNFDEIFINLIVNKGIPVFKELLQDNLIKKQIICFYQNINSAHNLSKFLSIVAIHAPEQIKLISKALTIKNPFIKTPFLNFENTLGPFIQIIMILQNVNKGYRNTFSALFNQKEKKYIILNTHFHLIGNLLSGLRKSDTKLAIAFFNLVTITELIPKAQQVSFNQLGKALNELKNIDAKKAEQIFDKIKLTVLVKKAQQVSFDRLGNALNELKNINIEKTGKILKSFDLELLVSKIHQGKYNIFLYYIPTFARIDGIITQQLLTKLPYDFLFQFGELIFLPNFNRLLFTFHFSRLSQYAEKLVAFASENMDSFMRSKKLKDITSFLNLCSHYLDMKSFIEQYRQMFFGKIRFGEPSEIPYFIRTIHDHDKEIALELLDYIKKNIAAKDVLGYCFYQLATSFSEQENFIEATSYLKKAIHVFEEVRDHIGLCYTYFALAKNTFALNNVKKTRELYKKALSYARIEGRHDLQEKIKSFIADNLPIS